MGRTVRRLAPAAIGTEAAKYHVLPLNNSGFARLLTPRPSAVAGRTVFTYTGENAGIPIGNAPSILDKDYTITAEVTIPKGGAQGMIVTLGGRFGGYGLYLLNGKPVFDYNLLDLTHYRWEGGPLGHGVLADALKPGKHVIVFDFKYDGSGPGSLSTVPVKRNGSRHSVAVGGCRIMAGRGAARGHGLLVRREPSRKGAPAGDLVRLTWPSILIKNLDSGGEICLRRLKRNCGNRDYGIKRNGNYSINPIWQTSYGKSNKLANRRSRTSGYSNSRGILRNSRSQPAE